MILQRVVNSSEYQKAKGCRTNINLSTPLFFIFRNAYPSIFSCIFSLLRETQVFQETHFRLLWYFVSFKNFSNLRKYIRVQKDTLATFSNLLLCGQDYKMSWAMQTVWRTAFVRSFCMAHVNINFIRLPTLEKSKKGERCPLYIGAYFADCKMLKDTET